MKLLPPRDRGRYRITGHSPARGGDVCTRMGLRIGYDDMTNDDDGSDVASMPKVEASYFDHRSPLAASVVTPEERLKQDRRIVCKSAIAFGQKYKCSDDVVAMCEIGAVDAVFLSDGWHIKTSSQRTREMTARLVRGQVYPREMTISEFARVNSIDSERVRRWCWSGVVKATKSSGIWIIDNFHPKTTEAVFMAPKRPS